MFKKLIEKLYLRIPGNLAYYDQHTRIHNRNYYEKIIKYKYRHSSLYFGIIDLDNLKVINDKYGHQHGDFVLSCLARFLASNIAFKEVIRYGGDEFVIMYDETIDMTKVLDNFTALSNGYSFSFGIFKKHRNMDIDECFNKADKILYKYKKSKKELQ